MATYRLSRLANPVNAAQASSSNFLEHCSDLLHSLAVSHTQDQAIEELDQMTDEELRDFGILRVEIDEVVRHGRKH